MSRPVIFLDRDGTLNPDPGYISSLERYEFYEDALGALGHLAARGFRFVVVTNQSGIGRGIIKREAVEEIHSYIFDSFKGRDIPLLGIYYCDHGPDEGCRCRKPATGLFEQAATDHSIDLDTSYVIGDSIMDMVAGKRLGIKTVLVRTGNGKSCERDLPGMGIDVDYVGDSLADCARFILSREETP
ncbi:MAG: D-glycero-alpha-D-manno-heptose-1,7-bisphosphate 7-phosphatase [Fidelibacterota bacterium]